MQPLDERDECMSENESRFRQTKNAGIKGNIRFLLKLVEPWNDQMLQRSDKMRCQMKSYL